MANATLDDWVQKTFGLQPASFAAGGSDPAAGQPNAGQAEIDPSSFKKTGAAAQGVAPEEAEDGPHATSGAEPAGGGEGGPDLGALVSAGTLAYTVFKDGKPSVDAKSQMNFAVPKNSDGKLTQAKGDSEMKPGFGCTNTFGIKTVDLQIDITWRYGLTYKGRGMYINAASISATGSVLWGYTATVSVEWGQWEVKNGKTGPIAILPFVIHLQVGTLLKSESVLFRGAIQGDGAGYVS